MSACRAAGQPINIVSHAGRHVKYIWSQFYQNEGGSGATVYSLGPINSQIGPFNSQIGGGGQGGDQ